mmetsp:Transcript_32834/g.46642  ORF Transcript_32834/g.46642 Transcript_32834/m.46642 type:complete len:765 (+) Transcript_32834:138-2432(+)|eukprot:CAMPEP_0202454570 /NCGR_PEP_ID=MMETSP1360-20130828/12264_1 /ASSEMBLY_ACC=CAM_ASM_000848 /TAXON_ID=515479 /ORGANISM="Licmophora paradoxa, Strain CCMP2313" /LENGTH=764 /DNA_ID=CAMNT_0049073911 /DNA_START=109 /DNA_END=2403 /DNA_ORIENTATION=+
MDSGNNNPSEWDHLAPLSAPSKKPPKRKASTRPPSFSPSPRVAAAAPGEDQSLITPTPTAASQRIGKQQLVNTISDHMLGSLDNNNIIDDGLVVGRKNSKKSSSRSNDGDGKKKSDKKSTKTKKTKSKVKDPSKRKLKDPPPLPTIVTPPPLSAVPSDDDDDRRFNKKTKTPKSNGINNGHGDTIGLSDTDVLAATMRKANTFAPGGSNTTNNYSTDTFNDLEKSPAYFNESRDIESDLLNKQNDLLLQPPLIASPDQPPETYPGVAFGTEEFEGNGIEAFVAEKPVVDATGVAVVMSAEEEENEERKRYRRYLIAGVVCLVLITAAVIAPVVIFVGAPTIPAFEPTASPSFSPSGQPSFQPSTTRLQSTLTSLASISKIEHLQNRESPQFAAAKWISDEDEAQVNIGSPQFVQRYILAVFYFSTNGDNWEDCSRKEVSCKIGFPWLLDKTNECLWHGIRCTVDDRIQRILLGNVGYSGNNMDGTLPPELAGLSDLSSIVIVGAPDNIRGTIPSEYGRLSNLDALFLQDLQLEGTIPIELMQGMKNLKILDLGGNNLNGTLPSELAAIPSIREIELFENNFTGAIPAEWFVFTGLTRFLVQHNQITGTIPDFLWNNPKLYELSLENNKFKDTIPTRISNLVENLETLELGQNELFGGIPTQIYSLKKIKQLRLEGNALTGQLSNDWGLLTNLKELDLSNNGFSGPIPQGFDSMTSLDELILHGNSMTGTVSDILCRLKNPLQLLNLTVPSTVVCPQNGCCDIII